jgi:hypothetical protein
VRSVSLAGFVEDGVLHFAEPDRFASAVRDFEGKRVTVTVEKLEPRRSLAQNAKMWAAYDKARKELADDSGHTKDELHEFLKDLYCPETEIAIRGVVRRVKSTRLLTKPQMSEYLERCFAFFAQQGIYIPDRVPA